MYKILVTADWHLTVNPIDKYRWDFLDWLRDTIVARKVNLLCVLGDLTHDKDQHPETLVNRLMGFFQSLKCHTFIVPGQHDGPNEASPFFRFVGYPIRLVTEPTNIWMLRRSFLLLPYTRNPATAWRALNLRKEYHYVFMHQPIAGAKSSSGHQIKGASPSLASMFASNVVILSGDNHTPSRVGRIRYVGAPYPTRFGETHHPRVILISVPDYGNEQCTGNDSDIIKSIHPPSIKKLELTVGSSKDLRTCGKVRAGDHLRVHVKIHRRDYADWPAIKNDVVTTAVMMGATLCGVDLETVGDRVRLSDMPSAPTVKDPVSQFQAYGRLMGLPKPIRTLGEKLVGRSK